jgi:hypothetical protein
MDRVVINIIIGIGGIGLVILRVITAYLEHIEHPLAKRLVIIGLTIGSLFLLVIGIKTIITQEYIFKSGNVATGGYAIFIGTLFLMCSLIGPFFIGLIIDKKDKNN